MTPAHNAIMALRSLPTTITVATFVDIYVCSCASARTGSAIVAIYLYFRTRCPITVSTFFYSDFASRTPISVTVAAIRVDFCTRGPVASHVTALGLSNAAERC
jgi:hypothetical protein